MSQSKTVEQYYEVLKKFAAGKGLVFHPDETVVLPLVQGLFTNKERYGYPSCPCRLACGDFEKDRDLICPCDYAAPDIAQYGMCYCNLYVSLDVLDRQVPYVAVPERRPPEKACDE